MPLIIHVSIWFILGILSSDYVVVELGCMLFLFFFVYAISIVIAMLKPITRYDIDIFINKFQQLNIMLLFIVLGILYKKIFILYIDSI